MAWLNFNQAQSNSKKWPKKIKLPQMKFFLKKNKIKFSCTYQPLSFRKISKKILQPIYIYEDARVLCPKWSICPNFFFWKTLILFSSTYWPLSLCKFQKYHHNGFMMELWQSAIFGPKMAHLPKWEFFFRKSITKNCSFHSCHLSLSWCYAI